jgi:nucleoside-diphosphate-sugar epimerase
MKILITGSSGFIGTHLANTLTKEGHEIIHYDLKDGNDILDLDKLRKMGKGVDGIIDFAAVQRPLTGFHYPFETIETNIGGIKNVLQVATENKSFLIFSSSKTVYGSPEKMPVKESDPKNPTSIYSLTKLASEMFIRDFCKNYGLKAVVVRFSTIFGDSNDLLDRAIPTFMYKAINNIDLIVQDPERILDPTFLDDITPCFIKIIEILKNEKPGFFEDYNLAAENPMKIREIVELILKITDSKAKIVKTVGARKYDYGGFYGNATKIKEELGFKPTNIEDAMKIYYRRFLDALKSNAFPKKDIDYMLSYYERKKEVIQ